MRELQVLDVSIHAPVKGATCWRGRDELTAMMFQSTRP